MMPKERPEESEQWRGYTLDELRYKQALALARLEIQKERLSMSKNNFASKMPSLKKSGLVGRLLGGLSYLDYALVAYKVGVGALRLVRKLRK